MIKTIVVTIADVYEGALGTMVSFNDVTPHGAQGGSITMRTELQGARAGMIMEIDWDEENYDYGPIKGARLVRDE